jgi:hypothetical protein
MSSKCEILFYKHFIYIRLTHSHKKGDILGEKEIREKIFRELSEVWMSEKM